MNLLRTGAIGAGYGRVIDARRGFDGHRSARWNLLTRSAATSSGHEEFLDPRSPPDVLRRVAARLDGGSLELGRQGKQVVRLTGGDPFVFGRGGEEAIALQEAGVDFDVVPGITSSIAAPAAAGVPVTHRGVSAAFAVVTGHRRPGEPDVESPATIVVGAVAAFDLTDVLHLTNVGEISPALMV